MIYCVNISTFNKIPRAATFRYGGKWYRKARYNDSDAFQLDEDFTMCLTKARTMPAWIELGGEAIVGQLIGTIDK